MKIINRALIYIFLLVCIFSFAQANTMFQFVYPSKSNEQKKASLITYNKTYYKLAYKTYLASGDLKEAYIVSFAAVKQKSNSLFWRDKLAQAARWYGKPQIALNQYYYLAEHTHKKNYMTEGATISKQLYLDDMEIKFYTMEQKWYGDNVQLLENLSLAYERIGEPEKAIANVETAFKKTNDSKYLPLLATLYRHTGEIKKEQALLAKADKISGPTVKRALRQAEILYGQNNFEAAYNKLLAVKPQAKQNNHLYWKTLSSLAWYLQHNKSAYEIYDNLHKQNIKLESFELTRLLALKSKYNPTEAFHLALNLWKKQPDSIEFAYELLNLGFAQKRWSTLQEFFNSASPKLLNVLERTAKNYWIAKAYISINQGQMHAAARAYQKAIKQYPNDTALQSSYLWFLIENHLDKPLWATIVNWQNRIISNSNLQKPIVTGLMRLKKPRAALKVYLRELNHNQNDYRWWMDFAQILKQNNLEKPASDAYKKSMYYLLKQIKNEVKPTTNQLADYLTISQYISTSNNPLIAFNLLTQRKLNTYSGELAFGWILHRKNYALIKYLKNRYRAEGIPIPTEVKLNLAVEQRDKQKLHQLLKHENASLTNEDRALAAGVLNARQLSQTASYKALAQHPKDYEMSRQLESEMLETLDHTTIMTRYYRFGEADGPQARLDSKLFIGSNLYLKPHFESWLPKSNDQNLIRNIPSNDSTLSLGLGSDHRPNDFLFTVGVRHALKNFANIELVDTFQLWDNLSFKTTLGYNQKSQLTTPLLIAGVEHKINVEAFYELTARDNFSIYGSQEFYAVQNGNYLGNGQILRLDYNHKLALSYPDWTIGAFSYFNKFHENGKPNSFTRRISPDNTVPTTGFFIPESFIEYGIRFAFGTKYEDNYSGVLRPFVDASIFRNTVSGFGFDVKGGLALKVFGNDHLALFAEESKNQTTPDQINRSIGISYRYYF